MLIIRLLNCRQLKMHFIGVTKQKDSRELQTVVLTPNDTFNGGVHMVVRLYMTSSYKGTRTR